MVDKSAGISWLDRRRSQRDIAHHQLSRQSQRRLKGISQAYLQLFLKEFLSLQDMFCTVAIEPLFVCGEN